LFKNFYFFGAPCSNVLHTGIQCRIQKQSTQQWWVYLGRQNVNITNKASHCTAESKQAQKSK